MEGLSIFNHKIRRRGYPCFVICAADQMKPGFSGTILTTILLNIDRQIFFKNTTTLFSFRDIFRCFQHHHHQPYYEYAVKIYKIVGIYNYSYTMNFIIAIIIHQIFCPRTNIRAYFRAKWRLLFIYSLTVKLYRQIYILNYNSFQS